MIISALSALSLACGVGRGIGLSSDAGNEGTGEGSGPGDTWSTSGGTASSTDGTSTGEDDAGDTDDDDGDDGGAPCPTGGCFDIGVSEVCETTADCGLEDTCCRCAAYLLLDGPPGHSCDEECDVTACEAIGVVEPSCSEYFSFGSGGCMPAFDCNHDHASCKIDPLPCPDGERRTVVGDCWGECIPLTSCIDVGDCSACPDGFACLADDKTNTHVCSPLVDGCDDPNDCDCVGESPCFYDNAICEEEDGELKCTDCGEWEC